MLGVTADGWLCLTREWRWDSRRTDALPDRRRVPRPATSTGKFDRDRATKTIQAARDGMKSDPYSHSLWTITG
jgi:hypothetical protein